MNLFFTPHADDECLFGAFTLIREQPRVIVCCPSSGDYGSTELRFRETQDAIGRLGVGSAIQWNGEALVGKMRSLDHAERPVRVWAPDPDTSHPQHQAVHVAAADVFGDRLSTYHTYRDGLKVRAGQRVPFEPAWIGQKLAALACYQSQWSHPRAHVFFTWDLEEYQGRAA